MKPDKDFAVYFTDTDGSERKGCTVAAKSPGHAIKIAREAHGLRRVTEAVEVSTIKSAAQLMKEIRS
jgi:hypothetical protein